MSRPNKWWWGVLPLAVLWLLAGYLRNDAIETELAAKAGADFPWAKVSFSGRDATISGVAPDDGARTTALSAIAAIPGVRVVAAGDLTVVPEAKPFTFEAARDGEAVTLSGFVPNEDMRKTILDAAKAALPAATVTDKLSIARGAPAAFGAAALFGVSQLTQLNKGSFSLSDLSGKLTGSAASSDAFAALSTRPAPAEIAVLNEVAPPPVAPYTFEIARDGAAVALNGFVPSDDVRKEITAAVTSAIPDAKISDQLKLAAGAPQGFAVAAGFAVNQISKLTKGLAALSDKNFVISGTAPSADVLKEVLAAVPPGGFSPKFEVVAPKPVLPAPYPFEISRDGDAVALAGSVPSEEARGTLLGALSTAIPAAKITDGLTIRPDAPAGFLDAAGFAIGQVGKLTKGIASLNDGTYFIGGQAASQDILQQVISAAPPAGFTAEAPRIVAPAPVPQPAPAPRTAAPLPYQFEISRDGDAVALAGSVPSEDVRAAMLGALTAAIPGAKITDTLTIRPDAPAGFLKAAGFALGQMSKLGKGIVSLTDKSYFIGGKADSQDILQQVISAAPPAGFTAEAPRIVAPAPVPQPAPAPKPAVPLPYQFEISRDGDAVALAGSVPSEDVRAAMLGALTAAIPGAKITDTLTIRPDAPAGFLKAAGFALGQMSKLGKGIVSLTDKSYFIGGKADSQDILQQVISAAPPAGFTAEAPRIVAPAPVILPAPEPAPLPNVPVEIPVVVPEVEEVSVVVNVDPYTWSARKDANEIVLEGFVPDEVTRADIVGEATKLHAPAVVIDRMTLGAGAPAGFASATKTALQHLSLMLSGTVSLSNTAYRFAGEAVSADSYAAMAATSAKLPNGFTLAESNIAPPLGKPYLFGVERTEKGVILTGNYPSDAMRANIIQAANAAFTGAAISDKMTIASGAPPNFDGMVRFAIGQLSRLSAGKASVTDTAFAIEGAAATVAQYDRILDATKQLPRGFKLASAKFTAPTASPYRWAVTKTANTVTLSGFVPSEQAKAFLVERAATTFAGASIADKQEVALGALAGFAGMAVSGMTQLAALNSGEVRLDDGKFSISGEAPTQEAFDVSAKAAAAPAAGFATEAVAITVAIPTVRPYQVEVRKASDGAITLMGYAPNAAAKAELVDGATKLAAGKAVDDRLSIALGLPESVNFANATGVMLEELGKLTSGTARLADDQISFYGNAESLAVHDSVTARLEGTLPGGMRKKDVAIAYPVTRPYVWSALRAPGSLTLTGYYQREADKAAVLEAARTRFVGEKIIDEMKPAAGAPACYLQAVDTSMLQLSRLIFGQSDLIDTKLVIKGEAQTETAASEIRAATAAEVGTACVAEALITVRAPEPQVDDAECQAQFREVLAKGPIQFDKDKAEIKPESFGRLDNLAFVAKRCPRARVEISAHADSDASTEYNQRLSDRRAKSVVDYLVNSGIGPGRLTAVGFGETRPLKPNNSRFNKALNRRVEFIVQ